MTSKSLNRTGVIAIALLLTLQLGCKRRADSAADFASAQSQSAAATNATGATNAAGAAKAATPAGIVRYEAQPAGSKVTIAGTSTIHDWTMDSVIIAGYIEGDAGFPASALTNPAAAKPNVQAIMPVRSFRSYTASMDTVMQEHMNMDKFPRIEYRLIELKSTTNTALATAVQFDAVGALTVSGTTRTNTMPVTIEKVDKTKIKVTGSMPLKMTDFGVKPPAPTILGMPTIKTGDDIKITFEWLAAQKEAAKTP
jgi:polyisoprenoid-binding protein YceI